MTKQTEVNDPKVAIAETLAEIRVLAEEKKCFPHNVHMPGDDPNPPCPACNGSGVDPAYTALLDVVRVECECHGNYRGDSFLHLAKSYQDCKGTGYVDRDWSWLPIGALWGSLEAAMKAIPVQWNIPATTHNPDEAAAVAVLAALKEQAVSRHNQPPLRGGGL